MKKTRNKLPVDRYLYKWLCNRMGYRDALELTAQMPPVRHKHISVYAHFQKRGLVEIAVIGYYPSRAKLYSLHYTLVYLFNKDMLGYVHSSVNLGLPAKTALENFMRICKIEEDDLQLATAYKRWQRQGKVEIPGLKIY
jgi:hypothetical protein